MPRKAICDSEMASDWPKPACQSCQTRAGGMWGAMMEIIQFEILRHWERPCTITDSEPGATWSDPWREFPIPYFEHHARI